MKAIRRSTPADFGFIQDILAQAQLPSEQVPGCELEFFLLETVPDKQLSGLLGFQSCGGYSVLRGLVLIGSLTEEEMFQFFDEVVEHVSQSDKDIYMVSIHEAMFPFFKYFGFEPIQATEVENDVLEDVYVKESLSNTGAQILRKKVA
ncbi:MAG: hypothetical protein ACRCWQ_01790 [Bacilli bacterium]